MGLRGDAVIVLNPDAFALPLLPPRICARYVLYVHKGTVSELASLGDRAAALDFQYPRKFSLYCLVPGRKATRGSAAN